MEKSLICLELRGHLHENNVINVSVYRESDLSFREALQKFDRRYREKVPVLCGYCKMQNEYIEPAIQI